MINRYATYGAPQNICAFETVNQPHNVVRPARSLPIIKLFSSHMQKLNKRQDGCHSFRYSNYRPILQRLDSCSEYALGGKTVSA